MCLLASDPVSSAYLHTTIINTYGLGTISDLAYQQWATASIAPSGLAASFADLVPTLFPSSKHAFEYALVVDASNDRTGWLTAARARSLLNDTSQGLFNPLNVIDLLKLVTEPDGAVSIAARWHLTREQTLQVVLYFADLVVEYGEVRAQQIVATGSTIFASRTINDWLFNCSDPLLATLEPGASCSLLTNATDANYVAEHVAFDTIYSGAGDLSLITVYQNYGGNEFIQWNDYAMPVTGNAGIQSAPNLFNKFDPSVSVYVFESDVYRLLDMKYTQTVSLHGISMNRFVPDPSLFQPDPRFFQPIQGYANISQFSGGLPLYFSYPHMYLCNESYVNRLIGMNPSSSYEAFIDIEPISGATMNAHKRLQLNMFIGPELHKAFETYNPLFNGSDVFYPMYAYWCARAFSLVSCLAR